MRIFLATAPGVVLALLLAGCATSSQGSLSLPSSSSVSAPSSHGELQPVVDPNFVRHLGHLTPMKLLRLQAEGKLPGPVPRRVLERQLEQLQKEPRMKLHVRPDASAVKIWTSMPSYNYLLGTGKSGKTVKYSLYTPDYRCYEPVALKVDHYQNIYAGCEQNSLTGLNAVAYMDPFYFAGAIYPVSCPVNYCSYTSSVGYDGGFNANLVVAALSYFDFTECTPSCGQDVHGAGFEWWPQGGGSGFNSPTLIALPYENPVYNVYYMDMDASNNIYFDYYGCEGTVCGYGLAEMAYSYLYSWSFISLEPIGTYGFAGGVYLSKGGSVLNVIDQDAHTVDQYSVPFTPSEAPFNVSGPTGFGIGDPVSGAFDSSDKNMAIGDGDNFLDIGNVPPNKWKAAKSPLFINSLEGAAYTPSDK